MQTCHEVARALDRRRALTPRDGGMHTNAGLQAAEQRRKAKQTAREERVARMKGNDYRVSTARVETEAPSDAQRAAEDAMDKKLREERRCWERTPPSWFGFDNDGDTQAEYSETTGCRLVDMDLFHEHITRWLPCPVCSSHTLFCRPEHEYRAGLGGTLRFWCHRCDALTHSLPISKELPGSESKSGPGIAEANVRLVLGAAQIGTGETHMAQLCGVLNVPPVRGTTWQNAEDRVTPATIDAAKQSRLAAIEREKLAAYDRGTPVDTDGRVPICGEYDMCWAKRSSGKAYNSLEGSGSFLGAVTGRVLVSKVMKKACDRCNKGLCDGGER